MDPRWSGKETELNRKLRQLAFEQSGVLTAADLAVLGVGKMMIHTRVASGRLIPILRGAFALPGTRLTLRGRCRASVASAGPRVVVSHASALALYGLVRDPWTVHLTGESGVFRGDDRWRISSFGFHVQRHETRSLPASQIAQVDGIGVTSVERALRDFAATATPDELTKALAQGEKARLLCWSDLRSIVAASNGQKGIGNLRAEIEGWLPGFVDTESDPEVDMLRMIRRERMPIPAVNERIGSFVPDFLWKHLQLAVELDPYGTHSGMASHRQDHRKGIELETMGLRVVRFTGEDLYRYEARTAKELWTLLQQQSQLLGVPLFPAGAMRGPARARFRPRR